MKRVIFFTLLLVFPTTLFAKEGSYDFISKKRTRLSKKYKYNKYEDIISGSISLTVGMIGYYASKGSTLKLAYSGVQTVGVTSIGAGIYKLYSPDVEEDIYSLANRVSDKTGKGKLKDEVSDVFIKYRAERDRATRYSVLITSSILTGLYFSDALISNPYKELKNIYFFLGSINAIVAAYSIFSESEYEKFYFDNQKASSFSLSPAVLYTRNASGYGLAFSTSF
jgi:hypothetical protein